MKIYSFLFLILLFSCSNKIKVEAISVANGYVESTVSTINSGTVEARKQAELAFGTVGRISSIHSSVGAIINEGTIIAEIENADLKAMYEEANKEYDRAQELFKNGLVSISNLDSAKRAREVARINLEKTMIKAPFRGMITALDLKIGEFYSTQVTVTAKPMVKLIDLDKRIVKGDIDEVDLNKVQNNQNAKVKIPALKNKVFEAVVKKVVPFVSTAKDQDRTSQIELELIIQNEKEMLQIPVGASADVEIITDKKENTIIASTSFVQGVGTSKFVYLIDGKKLKKHNIKVGVGNYERTEILEGLKVGDKIARPPEGVESVEDVTIEVSEKKWP